ncbi:MAG: isopropanol dehydrogenase [Methanomicrobiaceae archaeon]|nr:isopropanol dehydrogenase [Methanomicrobiaceae archaeon]MDK2862924.1 isopropanol dehydrogenase [Methanomicrobiaceae archaeon]
MWTLPAGGAAVMIPDMLSTGFMGAENARIEIGATVVVLGIGPVGLCGIAGARLRGAGRIFAVGTRPAAIRVAKEYGTTDIGSYKDGNTVEQILDATDGTGVDAVIVAGGGPEILMDAINMAKAGSVISTINYFGQGIGEVLHDHGVSFIVDGAQTAGHTPIDLRTLPVDAYVFTGHKALFGIAGTGGFYVRDPEAVAPVRCGGTRTDSFLLF